MLDTILRFSLRFRGVIYALAVLLCGYGLHTLTRSTFDVFPEFAPPTAVIQIEAPGMSSEQVETLVTQPVESVLSGTSGIQSLRSKSLQGLSFLTMVFNDGTDVLQARQLVSERLTGVAATLPAGVQPPRLLPLTTATGVVMMAALSSPTRSLMELHDVAESTVKRHLLAVPGIADVIVFGGATRQLQVQVDPVRLQRHGLSLQDVVTASRQATGLRGAGFIENANQRSRCILTAKARPLKRWHRWFCVGTMALAFGSATSPLCAMASHQRWEPLPSWASRASCW